MSSKVMLLFTICSCVIEIQVSRGGIKRLTDNGDGFINIFRAKSQGGDRIIPSRTARIINPLAMA